ALGVVIDGVPPLLEISASDIQFELNRRKPGQSKITTQRKEGDTVQILSGIFEGKTTGTPIGLLILNEGHRSADYEEIKNILRPGHADFVYLKKYGIRDHRGGGRASGRETVARVAAGAIAKKILNQHKINILAYTLAIGDIYAKKMDYATIENNPVRCPDPQAAKLMEEKIEEVKKNQDSIGGIIEAIVHGCPAGLGDPVFDKLDAKLAHALMSIGSTKGVEFGEGFKVSKLLGSQNNDKYYIDGDKVKTFSNHTGGIAGGISTGENIILRVAIKPTASISQPQQTITTDGKQTTAEIAGRHDPCICPRAVPVVEAMIAITLVDALLQQKTIQQ
ncbi:MAG TPA: chorismate synthase, partial [Candidatus Omnitrophota bacterium]|nr:chorismate synthase [Candidatus Omnitrophota bacterium]